MRLKVQAFTGKPRGLFEKYLITTSKWYNLRRIGERISPSKTKEVPTLDFGERVSPSKTK